MVPSLPLLFFESSKIHGQRLFIKPSSWSTLPIWALYLRIRYGWSSRAFLVPLYRLHVFSGSWVWWFEAKITTLLSTQWTRHALQTSMIPLSFFCISSGEGRGARSNLLALTVPVARIPCVWKVLQQWQWYKEVIKVHITIICIITSNI